MSCTNSRSAHENSYVVRIKMTTTIAYVPNASFIIIKATTFRDSFGSCASKSKLESRRRHAAGNAQSGPVLARTCSYS